MDEKQLKQIDKRMKAMMGEAILPEDLQEAIEGLVDNVIAPLKSELDKKISNTNVNVKDNYSDLKDKIATIESDLTGMIKNLASKVAVDSNTVRQQLKDKINELELIMPEMPDIEPLIKKMAELEDRLAKIPEQVAETPDSIVGKINNAKEKIDAKQIKNLPQPIQEIKYINGGGGGGGVKKVNAGTNIVVTDTGNGEVTINSTASGSGAVDSVNGQTGTVVLDADDIDDTSTTNKFVTATDTTNLATLTNDSMADTLHRHSELSASDGSPNPALSVDTAGNVGIGTTNPARKFTILSSGSDARMMIDTPNTTSFPGIEFRHNQNQAYRALIRSDYEGGSPGLTFWTSNAETVGQAMVITGSGNVGIGTTSPEAKLAINGGAHIGGDSDPGDNNLLVDGTITGSNLSGTNTGDVTLAGEDYLSITNQAITANPIDLDNLSATGTPSSSTFLRGDNTWATPAGSGDVSKVGTPVNNQVGVWTGDGTIEGDAALTFDTTTDKLSTAALNLSGLTASEIVITDASKNLASAAVATYPSLTELSYVKGLSSAVQSQLNGKATTSTKLDDFATPDDNTDLNANTTNHGLLLKATAPAAGLTNVVAIENGETVYKNKALYDTTVPSTQAFGDSATVGTAVTAARRDHKHAMMANPVSGTINEIAYLASASTVGSLPVATYPSLTELSYVKGLSSAVQTQLTDKVDKSTYDAHSVLYATTDNTPVALTVGEQTVVGRATGGNISALSIDSDLSSVSANNDTIPSAKATKAALDAKLALAGGTMTGSITLGENTGIALDPAGSADGKWSGITVTGVSGYSQAFGDLVTLDKDDSRWEAVDISVAAAATGDARGLLGMVVSAGTDGNACTILLMGTIRADANFPTLTIGAEVFASTTGDITSTQPTTTDYVIRRVGAALTADEIYFNPSYLWYTHT